MAKVGWFRAAFVGAIVVLTLFKVCILLSMLLAKQFQEPRLGIGRGFGYTAARAKDSIGRSQVRVQTKSPLSEYDKLPQAPPSLKMELKRHEPHAVGKRDRIVHHVTTSGARALHLHARVYRTAGIAHQGGWLSNVTWVEGGYAVSLSVGSPSRTFSLLVDTGSDLTWLQSRHCTNCFEEAGDGYRPSSSSTYKSLQCSSAICQSLGPQSTCITRSSLEDCTYSYEYGDKSTTFGRFSKESILISSTNGSTVTASDFAFGVGTDNSVSFVGVDGILGLGQGPISFPSQLGREYGNVFSYCLQGYNNTSATSPIIFGEGAVPPRAINPFSTASSRTVAGEFIQYTPLQLLENSIMSTFWFVNLQGFEVEGLPMYTVPPGTATIIDSGTTISMLVPKFYKALKNALLNTVPYPTASAQDTGLDLCFHTYDIAGEPEFPTVTFNFELADWVLSRDSTFIFIDDGTWCLAMMPSTVRGIQIFGNVQQANFQVVYDQPNARLGFRPAKCDSL